MTLPKRRFRDYVVVEGAFALVLALPAVAVFAHRGFAPIALIMAAVAATRLASWRSLAALLRPPLARSPRLILIAALLALCLWVGVTEFWSPTEGAHWLALATAGMILTGYLVVAEIIARPAGDMRILTLAFCGAAVLALALFLFEAFTNGWLRLVLPPADDSPDRFRDITALGRGLTAITPSLFPAAAIIALSAIAAGWRRAGVVALLAVLFLVAFAAALELTIAANSAAILLGATVAVIAYWRPRAVLAALTFAFVIALATIPVVAMIPADVIGDRLVGVAPLSWLQRLYIWRNAGLEALSCLPLGCGADYARSVASAREVFTIGASPGLRLMPLHPHNVFLQVWLELGLPGVIFAGVAMLAAGRWMTKAALTKPAAAAVAGVIAATFVYWSVEASIWQAWRLGSLVVAAAGVAILLRLTERRAS